MLHRELLEDETTFRVDFEHRVIHVRFDQRNEDNCFIELTFAEKDAQAIFNMEVFRKHRLDLLDTKSNARSAALNGGNKAISFLYDNKGLHGTVFYPYCKVREILEAALHELWAVPEGE